MLSAILLGFAVYGIYKLVDGIGRIILKQILEDNYI